MATTVERIDTDAGWDAAVPVIRQLWTDADPDWVRSWREEDGYRLFGLYEFPEDTGVTDTRAGPGTLVAVAGVSVQRVLHHVRHAWIHDFVVDESRRGEGFGTELLRWVEGWARDRNCAYVALACRNGNDAAREFYEANDLDAWGQVLEREL